MSKADELFYDKVNRAFPEAILEVVDFRGERTLIIDQAHLKEICRFLRDDDDLQCNLLADIVADDMLPDFPRFAVNYHLYSIPKNHTIRLRVPVEDPEDGPETLAGVWQVATWLEMEVWDLMGIRFKGNNQLRRLFMPADWQGYPLRKDYPLGYEEVQFSFNWQAIDAKKPYAKE
ncbi:MAG: NADH-quinone oxidoreductase subunit C [Chloroflexi bacterium]|nr:NADH-quinone oxidoreductase subunit C [Chloroflexota bacterium]MCI0579189.1 NADH-quinone oxidoreductase subunit C [Chloroflexota bacterium]MCI0645268.1 NADH-quinone oxidoreductase subunit C [Chloroflexota bacterium]MCI0726772.1 NADH-quinone oxidoreductase subunit C [Chloroflexota bacterium]